VTSRYLTNNITKSGFETTFQISNSTRYVRALAMDSEWSLLRASDVLDTQTGNLMPVNGTINLQPPAPPTTAVLSATPSATGGGAPPSSSSGAAMPTAMVAGGRWAVVLAPVAAVGMAMV